MCGERQTQGWPDFTTGTKREQPEKLVTIGNDQTQTAEISEPTPNAYLTATVTVT